MRTALVAMAVVLATAGAPAVVASDMTPSAPPERAAPIRETLSTDGLTIEVVDITPRFLDFYAAASGVADADERFAIWQARYGFAAVPPGAQGEVIARRLLDEAWPRYGQAAGDLSRPITPDPLEVLSRIAALLELEGDFTMRLNLYVGGFEGNAFTASHEGVPVVALPVEIAQEQRRLLAYHEFTHAVHQATAGLSGGWERSIAQTMISEGLAMHVARELAPGLPDAAYVEFTPGWLARAEAREEAIVSGVLPYLEHSDADAVFRFTMGQGPGGLEREAYYAGWRVVQRLRDEGMSLADIARIPESDMAETAARALDRLIER